MPNWVKNRLSVLGPLAVREAFAGAARGFGQRFKPTAWDLDRQAKALTAGKPDPLAPRESPFCFHALIPLPGPIEQLPYDPIGHNLERGTWGIKWGDCDAVVVDGPQSQLGYMFDTAWRAPEAFLEKLSTESRWRELTFVLSWGEEDQTRGRFVVTHGLVYMDLYERMRDDGHECSDGDSACAGCDARRDWRRGLLVSHDEFAKEWGSD